MGNCEGCGKSADTSCTALTADLAKKLGKSHAQLCFSCMMKCETSAVPSGDREEEE